MHKSVRLLLVGSLMLVCFAIVTARNVYFPAVLQTAPINLARMLPEQFGNWKWVPDDLTHVVNPQQDAMSARIYTQTLTRLYRNQLDGQQIMLVIAYGADQRESLQLHYPEVCYPAQGFEVLSNDKLHIQTRYGVLPVRQMHTRLNASRNEPVTYWAMLGDHVVLDGMEKKISEMRLAVTGQSADGLLFRVSAIDPITDHAFASESRFVKDLMDNLTAASRHRLSGL